MKLVGYIIVGALVVFGIKNFAQSISTKLQRKTFISFDYEDDKHYRFLLKALSGNPKFDFHFQDGSAIKIKTKSNSKVKEVLTKCIKNTNYTLILIGENANKKHEDYKEIGYKNWINFEIARSIENNNKLIAVQINNKYEYPEALKQAGAYRVHSFSPDDINKAFEEV